ncbi:MAG: hypothetical protein EBS48_04360 [Actinobacteria bacterium]|jgi:hypothetical protein|nr:hypothetical protein [Actinomycetota bacterium]NBR66694.1 hypothetical protein [Actinomycetota bacterium]NBU16238.1 hypothetical protein [Actinomycetota bacterium]
MFGMRYLSLEWIDAMAGAVRDDTRLQELARSITLGVTQVVTDGPEGNVLYHLQLRDGSATFGAGQAPGEDVRMEQTWDTAVGVATHTLPAQEAFAKGLVRIGGDIQKLMGADPVFAALSEAFDSVRERTEYA